MRAPFPIPELLVGAWRRLAFRPFRDGIEICRLHADDPVVALLRYAPGARVPRHRHPGLETVLVLAGSQRDERGTYGPGTLVVNPAGSAHAVASDEGCVVLIQWERAVQFIADGS
ncbi:MAG: cupin domain-containing protein [Gammaproteobacteria bacterium]|nr:cupin domain-containing protein [Gammaproteobacteria bacterium]